MLLSWPICNVATPDVLLEKSIHPSPSPIYEPVISALLIESVAVLVVWVIVPFLIVAPVIVTTPAFVSVKFVEDIEILSADMVIDPDS